MKTEGIQVPVLTLRAFAGHSTFRLCHELLQGLLELHGVPNAGLYACLEVLVAYYNAFRTV